MSKRKQKRPKGWLIDPQRVDAWLYKAAQQMRQAECLFESLLHQTFEGGGLS